MLYVGEQSEREQCHLFCFLPVFSHFPHYPQANWALLMPIHGGGGEACVRSRTLWVSPTNSPVRLGVLLLPPQPPQVFSVRRFETSFPPTGTLGCTICLAPQLFLPVYPHANVVLPILPTAALPQVLSTQLPVSAPATSLDECFFFNSLVVRLPYSLIHGRFLSVLVVLCF